MQAEHVATKRAVNLSLNEALVRRARFYTSNLSATIEDLLAAFVAREDERRRAEDRSVDRVIDALNALHAETGLLSDEFQSF